MDTKKLTSAAMFLAFGFLFLWAQISGESIARAFFMWWPLLMIIPGAVMFAFGHSKEHEKPDRRHAGIFLIVIGAAFLLFYNGFRIELLTLPFIFPAGLIAFGLIKLAMAVFSLPGYKALDLIIFIWLAATLMAYLPRFSFNPVVMFGRAQEFNSSIGLSALGSLNLKNDFGSLVVMGGNGSVSGRYSIDMPYMALEDGAFAFDSEFSESRIMVENTLPNSSLDADVSFGSIEILSLFNLSTINAHVSFGYLKIAVPSGTEYSVNYKVGFGGISGIDTSCALSCEGSYRTEGYDSSERKVDITADVGFGSLEIVLG